MLFFLVCALFPVLFSFFLSSLKTISWFFQAQKRVLLCTVTQNNYIFVTLHKRIVFLKLEVAGKIYNYNKPSIMFTHFTFVNPSGKKWIYITSLALDLRSSTVIIYYTRYFCFSYFFFIKSK